MFANLNGILCFKPISSFEQGIIQKSVLETGLKVGMDYIESVN